MRTLFKPLPLIVVLLLACCGLLAAQDTPAASDPPPAPSPQQQTQSETAQRPVPANPTNVAVSSSAQGVQTPATEGPRKFYIEFAGSFAAVNNGYGTWKSGNVRFAYKGSKRFSPFFDFGAQTRPEGSQPNFGFASYVTINKHAYALVGIGGAPDDGVVLFPLVRYGGTLITAVPKLPGFLATVGFSDLRFSRPGGGEIYSIGGIKYYGRLILSGAINFNRDRLSGVVSQSGSFGFMYGSEKKFWVGAAMSGGKEAYQVFAAVPFDVRFNNVGSSAFLRKWVTKTTGFSVRYDYGNKLTAYQLHGITAGYFFDF